MNAGPLASQLSLEEKLAQLVFVRIGSNLPPIVGASDDESRVLALLSQCPVGGLLLFNAAWPEVAESLERLQNASQIPLLIAADLERGAGQQIKGLTVFPHAMAFKNQGGQTAELVARTTAATASEALAAGVHILFAPVADASTNPNNPIIATRAYAEDPHQAATLVAAAVQGIESAGGLSTAKHFPGHGDTSQDSHAELPMVAKSGEELRSTELVPFKAAIEAGVSLMMTAHVSYPGLDPTGAPATFSRVIIEEVLRGELGFQGVVCSDSLLMEGAKAGFDSEGAMAAAALAAGVDLLLDLTDPAAAVKRLAEEVDRGALSIERVDEAVARVLTLKSRIGNHSPRFGQAVGQETLEDSRRLA
ncbi:MAG: hypothetical protein KDA37_06965, partial [Planctomycetales bacterium]|nr:hypothetical protein [Planctomycetales bacterium]